VTAAASPRPVPDRAWLSGLLASIRPLDAEAVAAAQERQSRLTKPAGSLGALEDVSIRLCGLAGTCPPPLPTPATVIVFAADHGVLAQGVSPWPQEVTAQMVANFLGGGAAVNVLAAQTGADVVVVDIGVATAIPGADPAESTDDAAADHAAAEEANGGRARLRRRCVRRGTADLSVGPAMSIDEALAAIAVGVEVAEEAIAGGAACLMTGDMGIGNTTPSAALIAAFTGRDAAEVTGRGTGIDDAVHAHKVAVIRRALALHAPVVSARADDPLAVLAALGGLEHAGMVGLILGAAARRVPVILDGVIAGSAALVAQALRPRAVDACSAGHRAAEPGPAAALRALELTPLVDLGLRLGEGTGAVLALPLVQAAARVLNDMATFDSAGVIGKDESA